MLRLLSPNSLLLESYAPIRRAKQFCLIKQFCQLSRVWDIMSSLEFITSVANKIPVDWHDKPTLKVPNSLARESDTICSQSVANLRRTRAIAVQQVALAAIVSKHAWAILKQCLMLASVIRMVRNVVAVAPVFRKDIWGHPGFLI